MGKLIDLTNQKFGLWTVLYKVPKNKVAQIGCVDVSVEKKKLLMDII